MEKQIQAKTMLHHTKQRFFKETAQRNSVIQKLEKEVKRTRTSPSPHSCGRTSGHPCFSGKTVNLHIGGGERQVSRREEGAAAEDNQAGGGRREDHVRCPAQVGLMNHPPDGRLHGCPFDQINGFMSNCCCHSPGSHPCCSVAKVSAFWR